jgi:hypothetical protein
MAARVLCGDRNADRGSFHDPIFTGVVGGVNEHRAPWGRPLRPFHANLRQECFDIGEMDLAGK